MGPPMGQTIHSTTSMQVPPLLDSSDRGTHGGMPNTIPQTTGSSEIAKTFGGLSLSSSNASLDGIGAGGNTSASSSTSNVGSTQLKKLSLSGIQEFVPSSNYMGGSQYGKFYG